MLAKEIREVIRDISALMHGNFLVVTLGLSWLMSWQRIFYPYESVYIRSMGASSLMIGTYFAANGLIRAIAKIPGGYLCDTYGRRRIVVIGNYLSSVVWFIIGLAPGWQSYFMAQFLLSLVCFWTVAEHTILVDSMKVEKRGLSFSLSWMVMQLVGLASPYIGGWVLETHQTDGLRLILFLIGVADAAKALVYTKLLKETLVTDRKEQRLSFRSLTDPFMETFRILKWMPRSLLGFCVMEVLFGFSWSVVGPFFILYAFDVISLTPAEWGLISTIEIGVSLLLCLPGGRLADRYSKRRLLLILLVVDAPGCLLYIYSRSYLHVLILFVVWTAIEMLMEPSWDALQTDLTPKDQRGKVSSFLGILGASFGFLGSVAGGYFYGIDPALPFWILIPFPIIAASVAFFVIHEPEKPEE